MRLIYWFFPLLLLYLLQSSCVTTENLTYLQSDDASAEYVQLSHKSYRVQPNDILNIKVRSFDETTNSLFNTVENDRISANAGDMQAYLSGYSVSEDGYIDMPVLGKVYVLDKNITEIKQTVEERLSKYFKGEAVYVLVQLAGVRFSIVGEVSNPGKFVVYQNQVNIFEAIAVAGDITIVGDRKEVQIIRQTAQGVETINVNLLNDDILASPYFFIQPNDIINVKPLPAKSLGVGTTGFSTIGSLLSIITSTLVIIVTLNSLSN